MPVNFDIASGDFSSQEVTLGGRGDSYYEYLLKVWILFGKTRFEWMREMWEQAMDEMIKELVAKTQESKLTYLMNMGRTGVSRADEQVNCSDREIVLHLSCKIFVTVQFKDNRMEHLACFVAGMLALGVHHKAMPRHKADQYMEVAEGLAETCFQMYKRMPTGREWEGVAPPALPPLVSPFSVFSGREPFPSHS